MICLDIKKGDILLGGRFKNVKQEVKTIGTDDLGQPTVNKKKLLSFRIAKKMPKKEMKKESGMDLEKIAHNAFNNELEKIALSTGTMATAGERAVRGLFPKNSNSLGFMVSAVTKGGKKKLKMRSQDVLEAFNSMRGKAGIRS